MIAILIFLTLTLVTAYPLIRRLLPELSSWPTLALSYLLGSTLLSVELFLFRFVFNFTLNASLWILWLGQIMVLWYAFNTYKQIKLKSCWSTMLNGLKSWRQESLTNQVLLVLLIVQIVISGIMAYLKPVASFDSLTMWSLKPELLYADQAGFVTKGSDNFYATHTGQVNYPWQITFQVWQLSFLNQGFDSALLNYVYWLYYLALLIILYAAVKENRFKALALTVVASGLPLLFFHSWSAYADLPLAVYGLTGLWLAMRGWKQDLTEVWPAWLFWMMAIWVKNEGIFYLLAGTVFYVFSRLNIKKVPKSWKLALCWLLPVAWIAWLKLTGLGLKHSGGQWGFYPQMFRALGHCMFSSSSFGLLFFGVIGYWLSFGKQVTSSTTLKRAWLWFALLLSFWLVIYLFGPSYAYVLDGTAVQRNMLTWIPMLFLLMGFSDKKNSNA